MDAKLIEDARAWQADRVRLVSRPMSAVWEDLIASNETAFDILSRLAELPLEGGDR